jgi:hypothetical protein
MRRPTTAVGGRRRSAAAAAAAGVLVIGLAAACNDDNGDGESVIDNDPPSDTTPASTEPTAEPKTPNEKAIEAAKQAVRDFYEVDNAAAARPREASDEDFRQVATLDGFNDLHNDNAFYRRKGWKQNGETQIVGMKVRWVKLANKPKQQPPLIPTVRIDVCYDVSDVNVVDKTGHSVVDPSRPDRGLTQLWVHNYQWPSPDGWKVGATEGELKPCAS